MALFECHSSETLGPLETIHAKAGAAGLTIGDINGALERLVPEHRVYPHAYTLSATQEEALCYSSTLYATLKPEWYPWPNLGPGSCAGIFSSDVVVFRDTLSNYLVELPKNERHVVSVMTIAAPMWPKVTESEEDFARESDARDLDEKILLMLRMAAMNGCTSLVLGAMGCGAYGCPPKAVARRMKTVLESEEFKGWYGNVVFAVYAAGPSGQRNLDVFRQVFGET
jgi:uncharacterized protein (TIGR02452 family)